MNSSCSHHGCYAPTMTCVNGEDVDDCPHFANCGAPAGVEELDYHDAGSEHELRFPWTGNAMGPTDLPYLAGASTLRLLTLAGASDAGKTSLLAAFYLLIARGVRPEGVEFAGSVTLEGWENIAGSLRWTSTSGPTFPPHTSSGSGRHPGMLHLSLSMAKSRCELVAADAPGEWFSFWASKQDSPQGEGARWLAKRTDVFLVIADSQALAGPDRGKARVALSNLLRRVGAEAAGRPIAFVWTKCDVVVPAEMEVRIKEAAERSLGRFQEFRVSMFPPQGEEERNCGQGIVELFQWILAAKPTSAPIEANGDVSRALFQTFGALG